MEPLLFVIAIMGCSDVGGQCTVERQAAATFRTEASCRAAQDDALMAASDLDYPVIVADCRPTRMRMADATTGGNVRPLR